MLSFVLTTLVAVASVSAQTSTTSANPACTSATFNIESASDLTTLTACTNVEGNVVISPTLPTVDLGGITTISGDLSIINNGSSSTTLAQTATFRGPSLQSVSGTFTLTELTQLNSLSFPSLSSVGGISMTTLPVLTALGFGGLTTAESVLITDTQLETLNGINLSRASTISITNNRFLSAVAMNSLTEVDTSLLISANAAGVSVSFPVLTNCGNFTVQQVANLSINALANVTGSMGIQQTTLSQVQANNLTRITADLFITNNTLLQNISMPSLVSVSGFQIANNTALNDINYPALTTVGAVDLTGTFQTVELPSLNRVLGGVNVQTTATSFTCPISQSQVQSTSFTCRGAVSTPRTANGTNTGSGGTTTTSGGAATTSAASGAEIVKTGSTLVAAGLLIVASFAM